MFGDAFICGCISAGSAKDAVIHMCFKLCLANLAKIEQIMACSGVAGVFERLFRSPKLSGEVGSISPSSYKSSMDWMFPSAVRSLLVETGSVLEVFHP